MHPGMPAMQGGMRGWTKKQSHKFHPHQHNACASLRSTIDWNSDISGRHGGSCGQNHFQQKKKDLPTRQLAGNWYYLRTKRKHVFVLSCSLNHHPCATAVLNEPVNLLSVWILPFMGPDGICTSSNCPKRYNLKITVVLCVHIYPAPKRCIHTWPSTSISIADVLLLIAIRICAGKLVSVWDDLLLCGYVR